MRVFYRFFLISAILFLVQPITLANIYSDWYDSVWAIINEQYLDTTYNNQDWKVWKNKYSDKIKTEGDAVVAINTMLETLGDEYTVFITPSHFENMRQALSGKAEGLGVELVEHNNGLAVHSVMQNSPAEKNGLKPKDIILSVNGTELKDLDADEAANLLIADEGAELTLLIRRKKCEDKIYKIKIEVFEENPVLLTPIVKHERIPQEILYTRIDTFANKNVAQYFHDIIKTSTDKKGLIIDLRGNAGGYVDRAATIGNMFLKNTLIVKTIDRNGVESCINANEHLLTDIPIVILVDCESASASEILAAAMKENERALLVGTTTFGKGIVQKIEDLPNGAGLNFTIKKYLTPKNNDIHKKGVEPDYKVHITSLDYIFRKDAQLRFAIKLLSKK